MRILVTTQAKNGSFFPHQVGHSRDKLLDQGECFLASEICAEEIEELIVFNDETC